MRYPFSMGNLLRSCALAYSAGTLGGIANFLFGMAMGSLGVMSALGINLPPGPFPLALYNKMVWGGIWGAMLFVPISGGILSRGFWIGLAPTVIAGLVVFPMKHKGPFGIQLSPLMPFVIVLFNWIWGIVTVWSAGEMGLR